MENVILNILFELFQNHQILGQALNKFIILQIAISPWFFSCKEDHGSTDTWEYSIEKINKDAGKQILSLKDAYGNQVLNFVNPTSVKAFRIERLAPNPDHYQEFGGFEINPTSIMVDIEELRLMFDEKHVGVYASGELKPKFALNFSYGDEKYLNFIILTSAHLQEDQLQINNDNWVIQEVVSKSSAPVDPYVGKVLSKIWNRLEK